MDEVPHTKAEMLEYIENLIQENEKYKKENATLKTNNCRLEKDNRYLENNNFWLKEQLEARNRRMFGRSSEKLSLEELRGWLFDEAELSVEEGPPEREKEEKVTIPAHTRKKPGRRKLPESLPREDIIHDLSTEEKTCPCCGRERPRIGEDITEELEYVPARLFVNRHVYPKYGPCGCKRDRNNGNTPPVACAPFIKRLIPGGIAGPGLLAYLAVCKFADGLPFYRMEKILERYGAEYSRATMSNQMIVVSRSCQEIVDLMWQDARGSPILHLDETTVQVLHEPGREASKKSFMWVTVGYHEGKKIILYHYHPSRSGAVAEALTEGYHGYIQTDGYAAYNAVGEQDGITHVGCWAHARRKFFEAQGDKRYPGLARRALLHISKLFAADKKLLQLLLKGSISTADFMQQRRRKSLPVLNELKRWVDAHSGEVAPSSHLGKALTYVASQWTRLLRYLEHPALRPDNNIVENAIRPFVIGRKNWLFANTPLGAHASATLYSLIESAKANGLEPYAYLKCLFTHLPATSSDKVESLLPYRIEPMLLQ